MIKVIKNNNVITISGHANMDVAGKDIVCASVSSIVYTTINAILRIKDNAISVEDSKNLEIKINSFDEITIKLITNMLEELQDLAKDYPKNINVKEN